MPLENFAKIFSGRALNRRSQDGVVSLKHGRLAHVRSQFSLFRRSPTHKNLPLATFCTSEQKVCPFRDGTLRVLFLPLRGLFFGGFAAFRLPAATNRRLRSAGGDSFRLAAVSLPGRQTIYAFVNSAASPRMVKARRSLNTNALILEILPFGSERPVPKVTVFPMSGSA